MYQKEDISAVTKTLESQYLAQGEINKNFEKKRKKAESLAGNNM